MTIYFLVIAKNEKTEMHCYFLIHLRTVIGSVEGEGREYEERFYYTGISTPYTDHY